MVLKNLGLRAQLATGFAAVVSVFVATLLVVAVFLSQLEQGVQRVSERSLPLILAVDRMDLSRSEVQQFLTDVSATHDPAAYQEAEEAAARFRGAASTFRLALEQDQDTTRLAQLAAIESRFNAFYDSGKVMAQTYLRDGLDAGNRLMKGSDGQPGFDQASAAVSDALSKFRAQQLQQTRQDVQHDRQAAALMHSVMLWGGIVATLLAITFGSLIVRLVLGELGGEPRDAARLMQRIGAGDLSTAITVRAGDSDSLMAQLDAMRAGLRQVVATVRDQALQVQRASTAIEQGSADLSGRTSSQASSLEQTAASMEQLTATVQQNVAGAHRAQQLADSASSTAVQGSELVARFVDTMHGINEASGKITEIIGVIDSIAFQTNILALNAAVEAARAGEQGRGFAVVAGEVRTLASRSSEAAKAIKSLIGASSVRVEEGTALVSRTQAAMAQVVHGIHAVSHSMADIAAASAQQSAGVRQICEAVNQMDQVTQQNASLVEESASEAVRLSQQAQGLAAAVAVFRLEAAGAGPTLPQGAGC